MSFGTNTSGYREHEMRRQSPMLIGVSLSQQTVQPVEKVEMAWYVFRSPYDELCVVTRPMHLLW